jgi:hypothetical protein
VQARQWWWAVALAAVAVLWNPIVPLELDRDLWLGAHYAAAIVFIAAGILVKVRNPDDRNARDGGAPGRTRRG